MMVVTVLLLLLLLLLLLVVVGAPTMIITMRSITQTSRAGMITLLCRRCRKIKHASSTFRVYLDRHLRTWGCSPTSDSDTGCG